MTFHIDEWVLELAEKVKHEYGNRVNFIGLQGSYRRKEANDRSDIDIVVILNELTLSDLEKYRAIISCMPYNEKACGFISGQNEIMHWDKADLFQFYYDTQPVFGSIDSLRPLIGDEDVKRAVKIGACNVYHASCHNYLYENSAELLSALYKSTFFVLQAKYFTKTHHYISSKTELEERLTGLDQEILRICMDRKKLAPMERAELIPYYEKIISWSSTLMQLY